MRDLRSTLPLGKHSPWGRDTFIAKKSSNDLSFQIARSSTSETIAIHTFLPAIRKLVRALCGTRLFYFFVSFLAFLLHFFGQVISVSAISDPNPTGLETSRRDDEDDV